MSVPHSINSGLGTPVAAGSGGALATSALGAPTWIPVVLIAFTLIFLGLLTYKLMARVQIKVFGR
jgi:hypothetical protein